MAVTKTLLKARLGKRLTVIAVFSFGSMAAILLILLYFRILASTPSIAEYPVRGIDVSHHNGQIDWDRVAAQGIRFAYIKASEGNDLRDPLFEYNWTEVRRVGLIPGAFHVFGNCSSGPSKHKFSSRSGTIV
jgi:lysozyme